MVRRFLSLGKDGYTMFSPDMVVREVTLTGQAMLLDFFDRLQGQDTSDDMSHRVPNSPWASYPHVVDLGNGRKAIAPIVEGRIQRRTLPTTTE